MDGDSPMIVICFDTSPYINFSHFSWASGTDPIAFKTSAVALSTMARLDTGQSRAQTGAENRQFMRPRLPTKKGKPIAILP